ncbi:hypothetical protein CDIK_4064, partial [Cucumispora dikerogammari]
MFFTNNLSYDILEDNYTEVNLVGIERGALRKINLHREMLGLCPLILEQNLDSLATEITKHMIEDRDESVEVLSTGYRLTDMVNKLAEQTHLGETYAILYTDNEYTNPLVCVDMVSFLQSDNKGNKILSSAEYRYFGIKVNIGLRPKNNKRRKTNEQDFYLYSSLVFSASIEQPKELSVIKISPEISDHIIKYKDVFCYHLNKFIFGEIYFRGCMIKNAIETNSRLNTIADKELISSISERNDDDKRKKCVATHVVQQSDKKHIDPEAIILHLPRYEAPSRLLFIDKAFSERLKSLLKNKKIREFGMSVVMLEDKTFHLL